MVDPTKKYFNWMNVRYGSISINVSYPSFSFNNVCVSFHCCFPLSLTWFYATSWENLIPPFDFSEGIISSLKWSEEILSPMKYNVDYNEQNTQAILFSCEMYYFGSLGSVFYYMPLCVKKGLQKARFLNYQTIESKTMALDT